MISRKIRNQCIGAASAIALLALSGCSNPDAKLLKEADAFAQNGELTKAVELYEQISDKDTKIKAKATTAIKNMVTESRLRAASTEDFANVLESYNALETKSSKSVQGVYDLAVQRILEGGEASTALHDLLHAAQELRVETPLDMTEQDQSLITAINEKDPTHVKAASELSEILFAEGKIEAAKAVLLPVKDNLGSTEGARILGQIFISEGQNKDAYPLLSDYTSARLETFQAAEARYGELQSRLWDAEFDRLSSGDGPESFYDTYDATPEDQQQLLVDNYISEKVGENAEFQSALNDYREAASIVPVVMDFGILQLRNAETMTSEAARKAELKAAEKTFLSIKNIAGDSDDFNIYLGQVYFWLGQQDQGQALFDDVLKRSDRDPAILMSVASTLRDLGKVGPAAALTEEAYDTASNDEIRHYAATMMQYFSVSIEDKIKWLERSDTSSPYIKASIFENKGHLATKNGKEKQAVEFYQKAIDLFESLPEDATNYNNTAIAYFSLYGVTGNSNDYGKGAALMSKAVELAPDQSILLSNSAATLVTKSLFNLLGDTLDFAAIKTLPTMDHLRYFYNDNAGKQAWQAKLAAHPDLVKAIEYYERSILLSPNSLSNYREVEKIYSFLNKEEAMTVLAAKMQANQVDVTSINEAYLDYVKNQDRDTNIANIKEQINLLRKQSKTPGLSQKTQAVIHAMVSDQLDDLVNMDETSGADDMLKAAEKAYQLDPTSGTRSSLALALISLGSVQTAQAVPAYAELREKSGLGISDYMLVAAAIGRNDDIGSSLKANPNIKRAIALEVEHFNKFPDYASAAIWSLFQSSGQTAKADEMAARLKASKVSKASSVIAQISYPLSGSSLVSDFLRRKVMGESGIPSAKLDELADLGIPIPDGLLQ